MDFFKKKKKPTPQGGKQRSREKQIMSDGEDNSAAAVQQQQQKPDLRRDRNDNKAVGKTAAVVTSHEDRRVDLPAVSERRVAATESAAATRAVYSFDEYGGDPRIDHKTEEFIAAFRNKLKNQEY